MKRLAGVLGHRGFQPIGKAVGHLPGWVGDMVQVSPNPPQPGPVRGVPLLDEQSAPRVEGKVVFTPQPRRVLGFDGVDGHADVAVLRHGVHHWDRIGTALGMHTAQDTVDMGAQPGASVLGAQLHAVTVDRVGCGGLEWEAMGTLWSEFRRGMRRGKPPPLPAGLARCEECGEPRGRASFTDGGTGVKTQLDIACICAGLPCGWCGQMPVRRPASNRFDAETSEVWHSGTWASDVPCAGCRAGAAAGPPGRPDVAGYDIWATPFYGEVPASADYFNGKRYRTFEDGLAKRAARRRVEIVKVTRVQGVWQGQREPAAMISVNGRADSVLALMADLARRWGQEGVICFSPELPGDARLHTGSTHLTAEDVCDRLEDPELSGVTVDPDGRVTILDLRGDRSDRARTALNRLGSSATDVAALGFLHLRREETLGRAT